MSQNNNFATKLFKKFSYVELKETTARGGGYPLFGGPAYSRFTLTHATIPKGFSKGG